MITLASAQSYYKVTLHTLLPHIIIYSLNPVRLTAKNGYFDDTLG